MNTEDKQVAGHDNKFNACLDPRVSWTQRIAFVEREARFALSGFGHGRRVSTVDLIETLYPERLARGADGHAARKSLGRLLRTLATTGLADCARRGETRKVRGKIVEMWTWGAPEIADGLPVFNPEHVEPGVDKTTTVRDLAFDLWWFIENVTNETPDRAERFFALRERVRAQQTA